MKQQLRSEATKERILNCAETLFAEKGYAGTSIRQIVSEAGVSIQTLHYHFINKQSLYHKVMERAVLPILEMLNRHVNESFTSDLSDGQALQDFLDQVLDELFDVFSKSPNAPRLFYRQWLQQDRELLMVEFDQIIPAYLKWSKISEKLDTGKEEAKPDYRILLLVDYWILTGLFVNEDFISELIGIPKESKEYLPYLKRHANLIQRRMRGRSID